MNGDPPEPLPLSIFIAAAGEIHKYPRPHLIKSPQRQLPNSSGNTNEICFHQAEARTQQAGEKDITRARRGA